MKLLLIILLTNSSRHVLGRVSTQEATAVVDRSSSQIDVSSRRSLIGERCGGLLFGDDCAEGSRCIKAAVGGGRCLPVDCMVDAINRFNEQRQQNGLADTKTLTDQIFEEARVTPAELLASRANEARSDQTFREDSSAMQAIVDVMNNMENPFPELERELAACNHNVGDVENGYDDSSGKGPTPGQTMYYGFHIEGGVLYDAEFSVLVAFQNGAPNLTFIRGCFGAGGVGVDVSSVIGFGYTGNPNELLGCSTILTDFEVGAVLAAGITVGSTFPGVIYLDVTVGLGFTGEGFGIGLCSNWLQ